MATRSFTGKSFFSRKICPDHRTIRIIPKPQPIHFAERRAILQFLDRHGRLESFRQDIDRPGTFVAILRDKAGIKDLEQKCPIYIQVSVQERRARSPLVTKTGSGLEVVRDETEPNEDDPVTEPADGHRTFKLSIYAEPNFDHKKASTKDVSSYHWNSSDMQNPSFATSVLQEHVPRGVTGEALAWWDFEADSYRKTTLSQLQRHTLRSLAPSKMGREWIPAKQSKLKPETANNQGRKENVDDFGALLKAMRREA